MDFKNIRIDEIKSILHYTPNIKRWSANDRRDHIIGIQKSGAALHRFGYQEFVLSGNCILFFNRRDDYDVEVLEPGEAFTVHFTTYGELETDSFCLPISSPVEIEALLSRAEQAKVRGDELTLLSVLYRLCAEFDRIRNKTYSQKDLRMSTAKGYIDMNFKDSDCLASAVAQSALSARRFGELFRAEFDITPNRYLTERRVEQAKSMLETGGLTVTEVAELCGFSDVYYFSKVFKRETGVTPGKWK